MNHETRCKIVQDLLPSYIEGLTAKETNAFVSAHLSECAPCRDAHRAMTGQTDPRETEGRRLVNAIARARKRRRRIVWGVVALALVILAVCLLPYPKTMRGEYAAIEWRCGDAAYERPLTVHIDGVYRDYLFREDGFEGVIAIEGYPQTENRDIRLRFAIDRQAAMFYADDFGFLKSFGFILLAPGGDEFVIGVYEEVADEQGSASAWDGSDGLLITCPAQNRAEAVKNTNDIARRLSPHWLGGGNALE